MIAPSCSSLGPDSRHAPAPGAFNMLTIGRLASAFGHPATVYHKTIVLCTLALTEWPLRRGGLTRSLTESGMY
jgi:hypothetical protein